MFNINQNYTEAPKRFIAQTIEIDAECEKHGKYISKQIIMFNGGVVVKTHCPECQKIDKGIRQEREAKEKAEDARRDMERRFNQSLIPKRFADKTLDNYQVNFTAQKIALDAVREYINDFKTVLEVGRCLILNGRHGTGKTHLAIGLSKEILKLGYSSIFMTASGLIASIRNSWREQSNIKIDTYSEPDLLILDEIGVQYGSRSEKNIIFDVVNKRYENMKPTIIISNLAESELPDFIGERVVDRLMENSGLIVTFDWGSFRSTRETCSF